MTTEMVDKELWQRLSDCLNTVKLGVAGRMLYFDEGQQMFILAVHTTSPEKTYEAIDFAWDSIPEDLKTELHEANIGFAGKQI